MKVSLRPIAEADLPVFYAHQADPAVAQMAGFKPRDHDAFYLHWRTRVLGDGQTLKCAVLADGELAGNVLGFDRGGKRLVGYWYGQEFWGRGIASEALRQFLRLEAGRPLHAWVIPSNAGSRRVLEKNGFVAMGEHVDEQGVVEVLFELR